ncbi:uncharacterized protein LAESUDRAFT_749863 [Laetiporus sulphureus 93-53]|uniref:CUE domain-containing protein n=1 Tax=Laetiporus sulphureus 93-53 TaxID=1314785 RepID=A0A165EB08_9APHY|nr:uncharacterized protein LAESUDRAFT_749863 [Laetiporus sulphureus 93-53]KZT06630.1 hypothetical protein LAESUDRAFT_749863 [Laetiporus sulphureus 93-53]
MGEVVNVLVAVAVIVLIVRWATSGKDATAEPSPSTVLGFRPKNVTIEMVETVHSMFPDIPSDNIRYDLLRTGSVQQTTNTILERGFLPAVGPHAFYASFIAYISAWKPPPAYYTIYPRAVDSTHSPAGTLRPTTAGSSTGNKPSSENLITRYTLQDRIVASSGVSVTTPEEAGGKAVWEDSPEKREASLRERKARMVLAARQRLLEQQQAAQAGSSSAS